MSSLAMKMVLATIMLTLIFEFRSFHLLRGRTWVNRVCNHLSPVLSISLGLKRAWRLSRSSTARHMRMMVEGVGRCKESCVQMRNLSEQHSGSPQVLWYLDLYWNQKVLWTVEHIIELYTVAFLFMFSFQATFLW